MLGARLALTWLSAHVSSGVGQTYYIALFARYVTLELGLSGGEFGGLYTLASAALLTLAGRLSERLPTR